MIGKVIRGNNVYKLLEYLFGPGHDNEHADPHLVGAYADPALLEPPTLPDGSRDVAGLSRRMNELLKIVAPEHRPDQPVWHVPLRVAPEDRRLSDEEWRQVGADVVARTGLAGDGDPDGCRWVAVRHDDDHVHLVVTLARQDGAPVNLRNDFYRVGEACRAAEVRYGLRRTRPRDRTSTPPPSRAEQEKSVRTGQPETARARLGRAVRAAAAAASDEAGFFAELDRAGVLVRARRSEHSPGEVTGYAVAWPGDVNAGGAPVFYGGGRLGADLTLPKLRRRWTAPPAGAAPAAAAGAERTPAGRSAIRTGATRAARQAAGSIRSDAAAGPARAAGADPLAHAAADLAAASARIVEGTRPGTLDGAARALAQAGAVPYGRTPRATGAAHTLRVQARMLRLLGRATGDSDTIRLILAMVDLAEAIAELRRAQDRLHQARDASVAAAGFRRHATALSTPHRPLTPTAVPTPTPPAPAPGVQHRPGR